MLSHTLNIENKEDTRGKNSDSPNSVSDAISDINNLQKLNEYNNKLCEMNNKSISCNTFNIGSKETQFRSLLDHQIREDNLLYNEINANLKSLSTIKKQNLSLENNSNKHSKNERIYNYDEQVMTSSTLSTDDKSKFNIFHRKIYLQIKEFNKIIDMNKLQTTCNKIDIGGKINLINT